MRYQGIVHGTFIERPNRFIAYCEIDGRREKCHVKNTGRCKEILVPGAPVVLECSDNPSRKTPYSLIAVYKGGLLINIDSQAPNAVFGEHIASGAVFGPDPMIFPEHTHGDSRFDFYVESAGRRIFIEVKGVTLEDGGRCRFPDAPTERGRKHLRGLIDCVREGYEAYVAFIIQMEGMEYFSPNYATDPEFGRLLEEAEKEGVGILVLGCHVTEDGMSVSYGIPHGYDHS